MSRGTTPPTEAPNAGFTILETLLALAVVTITIAAIGAVMAQTARGARRLESHVALVQAANDVLWLDMPQRSSPITPVLSGRTMDHDWRMTISALDEPLPINPGGGQPWIPAQIRIQVLSASGATIEVQTVRLFDARPRP